MTDRTATKPLPTRQNERWGSQRDTEQQMVRLTPAMKNKLKHIAALMRLSQAAVIRRLIDDKYDQVVEAITTPSPMPAVETKDS